jgi:hypothetical protein
MIGMDEIRFCRSLGDEALLARLKSLVAQERKHLAGVLACLGEVDRRRLFAPRGFQSMFDYCFLELRYSEGAAYRRIHSARAAREFPEILSYLADGSLSLSAVSLLAPHLTQGNRTDLLARAQGKRKRDLERMIADISPQPDKADSIRYVGPAPMQREALDGRAEPDGLLDFGQPAAVPGPEAASPVQTEGGEEELARASEPVKIRFSFTGSEDLLKAVERARDLLRHKYPCAKLEDVFREAILNYLDRHDPDRRLARQKGRPVSQKPLRARTESRRIPRWVKDKVWERDAGRCGFVAADGRRCQARGRLEFDHIRPWVLGGRSDHPDNVRLLCRTHNQMAAREMFGEAACRP